MVGAATQLVCETLSGTVTLSATGGAGGAGIGTGAAGEDGDDGRTRLLVGSAVPVVS